MDRQQVRMTQVPRAAGFACLAVCAVIAFLTVIPTASAATGDPAWQRQIVGPDNGSAAFTAAVAAPKGGVYAAGWIFNATGDYLATRYGAAGGRSWLHSLDFSLHAYDAVTAATSDRRGDLIVAGEVDYPSLSQDEAIVKYGPGGHLAWIRYFKDPVAGQGTELAADAHDNVYVTTRTETNEIAVLKYSPSGARRWLRRYGGGPGDTQPRGIAVDAAGNVYVTGLRYSTVSNYDIVTLKYDSSGHRRWARLWDGPASGDDEGFGIAVTRAGAVYVAGVSTGATSGRDAVVLKYGTGGTLAWGHSFSSAGAYDDEFDGVALLSGGDVAATGFTSPGGAQDVLTARLSRGGHTRWSHTYNGPDNLADQGEFVAGGPAGAVYVAGTSDGATTSRDILTLKYSKAGHRSWARRVTSAGAVYDLPAGLVVTSASVYVAGQESTTPNVAVLLKYRP
jgi:Beta-propeller repeat